ncbi:MAG: hypothetical protein ACK51U_02670, partial [bacterium]
MPKRDTQLPTSLFQADKSISGSPSRFRTSPATNFAPGDISCIIHESRVKNPETTTRYKLQRLDLNNSLFCLSVTGLSGEKIM